jgi:hypothetical protein
MAINRLAGRVGHNVLHQRHGANAESNLVERKFGSPFLKL